MSYQDPQPPGVPPVPPPSSKDENMWAMLCHLSTLVVLTGIGAAFFGNIVAPLIIWLIKKDEMPFVDDQGKEVLNFQISLTIYGLVAGALSATIILLIITVPFLIALVIFDVVMTIIGAIKANQGEPYRYPLCIRFLK